MMEVIAVFGESSSPRLGRALALARRLRGFAKLDGLHRCRLDVENEDDRRVLRTLLDLIKRVKASEVRIGGGHLSPRQAIALLGVVEYRPLSSACVGPVFQAVARLHKRACALEAANPQLLAGTGWQLCDRVITKLQRKQNWGPQTLRAFFANQDKELRALEAPYGLECAGSSFDTPPTLARPAVGSAVSGAHGAPTPSHVAHQPTGQPTIRIKFGRSGSKSLQDAREFAVSAGAIRLDPQTYEIEFPLEEGTLALVRSVLRWVYRWKSCHVWINGAAMDPVDVMTRLDCFAALPEAALHASKMESNSRVEVVYDPNSHCSPGYCIRSRTKQFPPLDEVSVPCYRITKREKQMLADGAPRDHLFWVDWQQYCVATADGVRVDAEAVRHAIQEVARERRVDWCPGFSAKSVTTTINAIPIPRLQTSGDTQFVRPHELMPIAKQWEYGLRWLATHLERAPFRAATEWQTVVLRLPPDPELEEFSYDLIDQAMERLRTEK